MVSVGQLSALGTTSIMLIVSSAIIMNQGIDNGIVFMVATTVISRGACWADNQN
jgi:hypothetical protein